MVIFLPPPIHETLKESLILMSSEVEPVSEMKLFVVVIAAAVKMIELMVAKVVLTPSFLTITNDNEMRSYFYEYMYVLQTQGCSHLFK